LSENFLNTVATITELFNSSKRDKDKLGLLARSLRWHRSFDADDRVALLALGQLVRRKKGVGCWEVERAILEVLCEQAQVEHVPFLVETFRRKTPGKHSNDRRRLALQALSGVAARSGSEEALLVLEEGLAHHKKDTRGWTIGFLMDSYGYLARPLPQSVIDRLHFLVDNDVSPDVRVEAVLALANMGLVDQKAVDAVVAGAGEH
jgi:hypothetical protein